MKLGKMGALLGAFHDCLGLFEVLLWFGSSFGPLVAKLA